MTTNYVYPHIEFTQSTLGTIPQTSSWRSTIGAVGQFRRGPLLFRINSSQEFNRLYGADNNPGAKAVRQMLAAGATDIIISRAVSQQTASKQAISFYGLTPGVSPKIGYEGQVQQFYNGSPVATTGISLEFNYIGQALSSVNSFGKIEVLPTSQLNQDLEYTGQSNLNLTVEQRVTNSVALEVTSIVNTSNDAYLVTADRVFLTGDTGLTATLSSELTPQLSAPAIANNDRLATPDGGLILVGATNYTVLKAGSVTTGQIVLKATAIATTNVLARLDLGSKIYFNNAEVGTIVLAANPTNLPTTLYAVLNSIASIPAGATLQAQASIGNAVVKLQPTGVGDYQFLKISRSLYQAVVSNLAPGRIFYSKDAAATFSEGYLTVLSGPLTDPMDNTVYNVIVKGGVAGLAANLAAGVRVSLYETPVNGYIIGVSSTAMVASKSYPDATQWRNQLYVQQTNTLIDSYEFVTEAYKPENLKVSFLFVEPDGRLRPVDSGIKFDLPAIDNTGVVAFLPGSTYTLPIVRTSVASGDLLPNGAAFAIGTSASDVLSELKSQIVQNSLLSALLQVPVLSATLQPATLALASQIKGDQANRIHLHISRQTTGEDAATGVYANDLLLNSSNITTALANWSTLPGIAQPTLNSMYFRQGNAGASFAALNLYSAASTPLVRIVALSDGAYGNQIKISVNSTNSGQFVVNITDLDSGNYQNSPTNETLNLSTRDVDLNTGLFNATSTSGIIRAYYIPVLNSAIELTDLELDQVPTRIAPAFGENIASLDFVSTSGTPSIYSPSYQGASYLQGLYLQGGSDAALESDSDVDRVGAEAMVRAVEALEQEDIAILIPAGITIGDARYSRVVEACIGQVNRCKNLNTNRRLVLQAPPNLNQNQAALYGAQLNNQDITLVAGFCAFAGISTSNTEPSAPLYAATLSLSSPQMSPAYIGNGVPINGVSNVDTLSTPQYLDALTRAGVEAMYFDAGLGRFKFLNGRTTSRDPKQQQVTIRRIGLQMMVDLYINALGLLSAQNDEQLQALVSSSFDAYLNSRVSGGWIQSASPTICNESNNPISTQIQNKLNVYVEYTPYFPADIILVDMVQRFTLAV